MKYRNHKKLYALALTAIASTNAWSNIIVSDGLNNHTPKTIIAIKHFTASIVSSQQQVGASNSSNASTMAMSWDEQDKTSDLDATGLDGINLVTGALNSMMALNFQQTDQEENLEFRLWNTVNTLGNSFNTVSIEQALFIGEDGLSELINRTTAAVVKMFKSEPKTYNSKLNAQQSTPTAPRKKLPAGNTISAPATLTLVGVGLIIIGLTRKRRITAKFNKRTSIQQPPIPTYTVSVSKNPKP